MKNADFNLDAILDDVVKLLRAKYKGQTYVEYDGVSIVIIENDGTKQPTE